jgi:hypothetical protein
MGTALCLGLLLLASSESRLSLEGNAGLGGGYESNVTLAPRGEPAPGSPVAEAWAGLGMGWDPGESTYLSAGVRYDGTFLTNATDLSRNLAGMDLLWIQDLGDVFAVIVGAGGAWSWYVDGARNGPGVAARATLRARPLDWLSVRAGYGYAQRWAEVDVYSTSTHRVFGSVEARVARGVYLGLVYAWQAGMQTFYAAVPTTAGTTLPPPGPVLLDGNGGPETGNGTGGSGTGGTGPGETGPGTGAPGTGGGSGGTGPSGGGAPQGTGIFSDLVPYRASTTDSTLTPTFDATVWEGLYLFATYSYTWGSSAEGSYVIQSGMGGVGYRF